MKSPVPVAAPLRVRQRLEAAGDGPRKVIHHGQHALYLDLDGLLLGVVATPATAVPCALRVAAPDLSGFGDGPSAHIHAGALHLGGVPVQISRLVDAAVPPYAGPADGDSDTTPPTGDRLLEWVGALVGKGDGLTPYGDDVLCGYLAMLRAHGRPTPELDEATRSLAGRTTLLSATLLDCARHGEVVPEYAAWVAALGTDAEPEATARLRAIGHSSGRGLHEGGLLALQHLNHRHAPASAHEPAPAPAPERNDAA